MNYEEAVIILVVVTEKRKLELLFKKHNIGVED